MSVSIAVVGLACRYPDADGPAALWQLVLAQRRAFRRLPDERLPLEEYGGDRSEPDVTYGVDAAVLTDWEFDRARFRVAGPTYRTVDPAHWLALECAARALDDAGFANAEGLSRDTTSVIVGNTLTGDYSRAAALRLRWPYVRRTLRSALRDGGIADEAAEELVAAAETAFKRPLPVVDEETLAGWLSNTIAGRICAHFDLGGGGYVVDGACSSSLLAVTTACDALRAGTADVALAGAVDLSIDPFELVGFAKAQALADGEMRVYDRNARGFLPGEGCGFAVLMREADARARGCRIYASVRGWGVSSDGSGGITRPGVDGQRRALARTYRMAGYGIDSVAYFEGHGTGTAVGDAVEIAALSEERRAAGATRTAALGSIKANIGHTKAAAGMAGFIKAALAVHSGVVPPTTGCADPHPDLQRRDAMLRIERGGEAWPVDAPVRASVSAMGFGGINAHVALESLSTDRPMGPTAGELACLQSAQDCELLPIASADPQALLDRVRELGRLAQSMSIAELTDAAVAMHTGEPRGPFRAALVATTPRQLEAAAAHVESWLAEGRGSGFAPETGAFFGRVDCAPRIALLFPGQASPLNRGGGLWRRRFPRVADLYVDTPTSEADVADTLVAQPAIVRGSIAGLRMLDAVGIRAVAAVGHSLGELCALHWAEAFDEDTLLRLVLARATAMAVHGAAGGMASVAAPASVVRELTCASDVVVAGLNGPRQTVIGGPIDALHDVVARCRDAGYSVSPLHVSHAFHSPGMSSAAGAFGGFLAMQRFAVPRGRVISTVTADALDSDTNLGALLVQQLSSPVRFDEAMARIEDGVDLFIETGPGAVLTGLVASRGRTPVVALDAGADSVRGLLNAVGAAFTLGADVSWTTLTAGRFARRFDFAKRPSVLVSPCEADCGPTAPKRVAIPRPRSIAASGSRSGEVRVAPANRDSGAALDLARAIVARRLELPESSVDQRHRLLSDLHLNSITATQVIVELAHALAVAPPRNPTDFADASIETLSEALLKGDTGRRVVADIPPTGVAAWARTFAVTWVEEVRAGDARRPPARTVVLGADGDPIVIALREATRDGGPGGTIVCLSDSIRTFEVVDLLRAARRALTNGSPFTVVQRSAGAGAAARSMWLEAPHLDVLVATVDRADETTLASVVEEARCAKGFVEVQFRGGRRFVPYLAPTDWEPAAALPLGAGDVVLVTGGGRGITAECALELTKRCGARIGILGRAAPDADPDLARNLVRLAVHSATVEYRSCDVTDAAAVQVAVRDLERALGPITAVLHGAAINEPRLLAALDDTTAAVTVATKVDGLRNVLESVEPGRLRLCIAFGSLTARTGMRGDSHYASANELMIARLEEWALRHPDCRCLGIEWSVWAGTGMGERLGRLADLERDGITPLTIDQGTTAFCELVSSRATGSVVVTGRFPQGPTLRLAGGDPPLLRFLETTVAWYPGLEIVADAELTRSTDLYLDDHVIQGERVLPGVVGLEAMAQAAAALMRPASALDVELADVAFDRPIVVPAAGKRRVRVAALRRGAWVEAVMRSDETQFAVDHFRARCRFVAPEARDVDTDDRVDVQPVDAASLYAELLFQRGRFRRVAAYRDLHATSCEALLERTSPAPRWFDAFLPGDLVLGDPGAHDAALHAVQACVPESRLLPTAIERIRLRRDVCPRRVRAVERVHEGRTFSYDLVALDQDGGICGEWIGARFTEVSGTTLRSGWTEPLLAPAIERAAAALSNGATVRAFVIRSASPSPSGRGVMAERLGVLERRPDGRPEIAGAGGTRVSIAHDDRLVLAVTAADDAVGCDLQSCESRPADEWARLLGREGMQLAEFLSGDTEPFDIAATRVWCARECLTKAGLSRDTRVAHARTVDGWSMLTADGAHVLTRAFILLPDRRPVMVAVLLGCAASARATSLSGTAV